MINDLVNLAAKDYADVFLLFTKLSYNSSRLLKHYKISFGKGES